MEIVKAQEKKWLIKKVDVHHYAQVRVRGEDEWSSNGFQWKFCKHVIWDLKSKVKKIDQESNIKKRNACKQTGIQHEYVKFSDAHIQAPRWNPTMHKKIMEPCEKERNKRVFENIPVLLLLLPTSSPPKLKIPPKFIYLFIFCSQNNPPEKTLPLLPPKEKPSSSLSPTLLFTDQQAWALQPPHLASHHLPS